MFTLDQRFQIPKSCLKDERAGGGGGGPLVTCSKDSVLLPSNLIDNSINQFCMKTNFMQLPLCAQELCETVLGDLREKCGDLREKCSNVI